MRRAAGAGLLILILGGGHVAGWVADRASVPPPPPMLPAPEALPAAAARPAPRAAPVTGGVPAGFRDNPLSFLSSAPPDSLDLLPGIGPVLAARIVADRAARGPFTTWTELDRVRGIGPATIKRLEAAARRS